jgi:ribonuclease T2
VRKAITYAVTCVGLVAAMFFAETAVAQESSGYVLAASWEPAFCQTDSGRRKRECRTQTAERYDATHFSLHGLWPDDLSDKAIFPCYCDRGAPRECDVELSDGPRIRVSQPIFDVLRKVMPGVMSRLHQHEWEKHGTCYEAEKTGPDAGADPDEYYSEAIVLMEKLNASPVGTLFAENIGRRLTRGEIEAAFDDAFGKGAAERLIIACDGSGRNAVIAELRINLEGDITPDSSLSDLILAAPPTSVSTSERSCAGGKVAAVN